MNTKVVALSSFVHGGISAAEGDEIPMDDALAGELANAGLVRVKSGSSARTVSTKATPAGNVPAAGGAQPSSASRAAQVSAPATAKKSGRGAAAKKGKTAR